MGSPTPATTNEQKSLAALARIESKLDDTERRVKAVQQDLNRVKRIVRG
jgi:peptidoglycan hydrolase-like protein with peptidoglycan-binding domain